MQKREREDWMSRIDAALASLKREVAIPSTGNDKAIDRTREAAGSQEGATRG